MAIYQKISSKNPDINQALEAGFLLHVNDADVRRTHLFNQRYENIYLEEKHIPELKILLTEALELAEKILDTGSLKAGFWFNYMPPGATTTLHTHDDDDELLSCVYYVNVPENSGNLIIYDDTEEALQKRIEISSRTGDFIFFKPDVRHEVSKNNSNRSRLSIAFNFGRHKAGE